MCDYEDCDKEEQYALFRLKKDGTKTWVHICDQHDKIIVNENNALRYEYPAMTFKEVT